ncbi:hypothetical protein [Sanguibacter antarcticus]|uniref:Transmembrane protein n=1 Tax=Sanguibacter antarcticus TaxID=372484 RepID=A0A2A9E2P5_9MICO|nr:hypothetical protein [Sanguibacter antarcticus]PFG32469.1 hypothetical protein ATL42_0309 [Sanguibacter antarcticus]
MNGAGTSLDLSTLVDARTGMQVLHSETATPEPLPSSTQTPLREDLDEVDVSPGLAGFLAIFVVAVATIFLVLSMTRKLRRVNHRANHDSVVDATFDDRRSGAAEPGDGAGDGDGTD